MKNNSPKLSASGSSLPRVKKRTRAIETAEQLEQMVQKIGPGGRLPSIRKLCADLGVSLATMTTAMDRLEARGHIERRHGSGVYVTDQVDRSTICVLMNTSLVFTGASPVWGQLLGEVSRAFVGSKASVSIQMAMPPDWASDVDDFIPSSVIKMVQEERVSSLVLIGMPDHVARWFEYHGVPSVCFAGAGRYAALIDQQQITLQGGKVLGDTQCKRVLLVGNHTESEYRTFEIYARSMGMEVLPHRSKPIYPQRMERAEFLSVAENGFEFGDQLIEMIRSGNAPDGVYLADDVFAQGVFMSLTRAGMWPCPDITFVAHANKGSTVLGAWKDLIHTLEIDIARIGEVMAIASLNMAQGKREPWPEPQSGEWLDHHTGATPDFYMQAAHIPPAE